MLRERLLWCYNALLAAYGPQGWWPGDGPFEVMVGAVTKRLQLHLVGRPGSAAGRRDAGPGPVPGGIVASCGVCGTMK